MRILHVIASVDPSAGGPAEGLRQLCRIYQQGGHSVEVASLDAPEMLRGIEFPANVAGLGPGRGTFGYSRRAARWLKENIARYDVAFLNGVWQYDTLAAHRALASTGTPFAVFAHGMLDPYFKDRFPIKHLKKQLYWHVYLRRILEDANVVLFTCEQERRRARESFSPYRVREMVMSLGSRGPECALEGASAAFHAQWPGLRNKRLALFMGRIDAKKGIDILLRAFAETLARDPEWILVVAGPDRDGLRRELHRLAERLKIAERVTWTGMLMDAEKWGAYATAEVLVLPSHQENFGIVIAEAMACSLPVIVSNKVNIWCEVDAYGAGMVCDDTIDGLRDALFQWAALDRAKIAALKMRSKHCYESRFSCDVMAEAALRIVERVAGHRRMPSSEIAVGSGRES